VLVISEEAAVERTRDVRGHVTEEQAMTCHAALNRASWSEASDSAVNGSEDVCVVCGDVSAELICRAGYRLIGARRMRREDEDLVADARGRA